MKQRCRPYSRTPETRVSVQPEEDNSVAIQRQWEKDHPAPSVDANREIDAGVELSAFDHAMLNGACCEQLCDKIDEIGESNVRNGNSSQNKRSSFVNTAGMGLSVKNPEGKRSDCVI